MKITTRIVAVGTAGLLAAGLTTAVLATSASAAGARYTGTPTGTLKITPASGTDQSAINYAASSACPAAADSYYALLFGNGLPDTGQVVTSKTSAGFTAGTPVSGAFQDTPANYAKMNGTTLSGTYDVVMRCTSGLSNTSLGDFVSQLTFSSPTAYTANNSSPTPSPSATSSTSPSPSTSPSATSTATITPTPTTSNTASPGTEKLTLTTSTPDIQPNQPGILDASGTPNTTFILRCYSRPNTTYFDARSVPTATGSVEFRILPGTNTRCFVKYAGRADNDALNSTSIVVNVHTTLSLSTVRNGTRNYTFQGRNLPRLAGQLITLYRVDHNGIEVRTSNLTTDSSGIYRVTRQFTGTGTFKFLVRTSQTLNNAAGHSNVITVTVQ
ncbi:MAG: hypothetical protein NVS3B26_29160 [Mycobacteriales bacterium]